MKYIHLTKGLVAKVDDEDYEILAIHKWHIAGPGYAGRKVNYKKQYMHRLLINAPDGLEVDHINGDLLDNRRANLRIATRQQNAHNRRLNSNTKTGHRGVTKVGDKYRVAIMVDGETLHLGTFSDKELAAQVYRESAIEYYGEFARRTYV